METVDPLKSELRLFLSVDVVQSLDFKNRMNYEDLRKDVDDKKGFVSRLIEQGCDDIAEKLPFDSPEFFKVAVPEYSREDIDWAAIFERAFEDVHTAFAKELNNLGQRETAGRLEEHLWKLQGDELLYSFEIVSRRQLYDYVTAFLELIRKLDKEAVEQPGTPRLQGAGWVAGFPVRNRRVTFLENRQDWLGPDIDTGFRLSKHTHAGLMVISLELAELTGEMEDDKDDIEGAIVGWKKLKAVWDGVPYPIIWVRLHRTQSYNQIQPWDHADNDLVEKWNTLESKLKAMRELLPEIVSIRKRLPERLGIIDPYIRDEDGESSVPESHRQILKLLQLQQGILGDQSTERDPRPNENAQDAKQVTSFADTTSIMKDD